MSRVVHGTKGVACVRPCNICGRSILIDAKRGVMLHVEPLCLPFRRTQSAMAQRFALEPRVSVPPKRKRAARRR